MYRCGIILKNGDILPAQNFDTKDECDTWILDISEKKDIKKAIIVNKENIKERWTENF